MQRLAQGLLALSLAAAAHVALADDDCDAPLRHWQSRDAVLHLAAQQGWQVQRLKIDDGCYELRGTDAQGREFKAKLDPQTLRVVKMKRRERERMLATALATMDQPVFILGLDRRVWYANAAAGR